MSILPYYFNLIVYRLGMVPSENAIRVIILLPSGQG